MGNYVLRLLNEVAEKNPLADKMPQEDWATVGSTVVTGLLVVFAILLLLVFILWALGKLIGEKPKPVVKATPAPVSAVPSEEADEEIQEDGDDEEIIAVISAAIAAFGEADGKQYKITSVKRRDRSDRSVRSGWSAAGIAENTRGLH